MVIKTIVFTPKTLAGLQKVTKCYTFYQNIAVAFVGSRGPDFNSAALAPLEQAGAFGNTAKPEKGFPKRKPPGLLAELADAMDSKSIALLRKPVKIKAKTKIYPPHCPVTAQTLHPKTPGSQP